MAKNEPKKLKPVGDDNRTEGFEDAIQPQKSEERGNEHTDVSDAEMDRQEEWRENPQSREYFGPPTVPQDEMNPE